MIVDIQELARRMLAAYDGRTPGPVLVVPLKRTIAQAYAVQAEAARLREDRGEKIIGYKLGFRSTPRAL
jgi:2-keto-4-pentenoate hydratase